MLRDVDRRIGAIWSAEQAKSPTFPRHGDRGARVWSNEMTPEAVARLSPERRRAWDLEEARWAGIEAACEWLAREAALYDPTGADDPAKWRDGECAVHNGEPRTETEDECAAAAE